ncbi:6-phosphogluconolactonase [Actinomyces lilanjuaniae]|uniref:6-phosphogluconolactonase n=1 Tax=Actinomyces lilanjuaniae TaxID=2321394 RepID=UPI00311AAE9C
MVQDDSKSAATQGDARSTLEAAARRLARPTLQVSDSLSQAAASAAADTVRTLAEAVAARGTAHLALTGGSGGVALADHLAQELAREPTQVREAVHLWFGDERFVPVSDPERNDLLAAPLVRVGVPDSHVHHLPGPETVSSLDSATDLLTQDLRAHHLDYEPFDLIHLGLGPDAHVCSLFPGHPAALTTGRSAVAVRESPKPPPQRCSLTFEVLHRARHVMVVAGGQGKAEAVTRSLGAIDVVTAPASCARGKRTTWYLDVQAASGLGDIQPTTRA